MNTIIDPTDNMGYPITSEIGRNILKNYLINYKNGGSKKSTLENVTLKGAQYFPTFEPVTVYCSKGDHDTVMCSSKNPFKRSTQLEKAKTLKEFEKALNI